MDNRPVCARATRPRAQSCRAPDAQLEMLVARTWRTVDAVGTLGKVRLSGPARWGGQTTRRVSRGGGGEAARSCPMAHGPRSEMTRKSHKSGGSMALDVPPPRPPAHGPPLHTPGFCARSTGSRHGRRRRPPIAERARQACRAECPARGTNEPSVVSRARRHGNYGSAVLMRLATSS